MCRMRRARGGIRVEKARSHRSTARRTATTIITIDTEALVRKHIRYWRQSVLRLGSNSVMKM